jgi:hypothetical protein
MGLVQDIRICFSFSLLNYNMIELVQDHAFSEAEIARL